MADDAFKKGRQLLGEGRHEIALEHFTVAADDDSDPQVRGAAMAHAADINLQLGRPHEALVWVERLREESDASDQADLIAAQAEVRLGKGEAALPLLDGIEDPNTEYHTYPPSFVSMLRAEALAAAGREGEAVRVAVDAARQDPDHPAVWRTLAGVLGDQDASDTDLSSLADAVPEQSLTSVSAGLVEAPIGGAERLATVLWERWPDDKRLLVLMATIGYRLPVASALEWSARMRGAGQAEHCPLLGVAASPDRHPRERLRAAAAAGTTFRDDRARGLLELAATELADDDIPPAFDEVVSLAPDMADSFVVAASRTARRALIMAAVLDAGGNTQPAVAVARHALELTTGQPHAWSAAVSAVFADVEPFAERAEQAGATDLAAALRGAMA